MAKEEADRARLELGRALVAKKAATKHGRWLPMLADLGIEERTARRYMDLAGYVDAKSDTAARESDLPVPTYAEAGIDKRQRAADRPPAPVGWRSRQGTDGAGEQPPARHAAVRLAVDLL